MRKFDLPKTPMQRVAWIALLSVFLVTSGAVTLRIKGVDIFAIVAAATSSLMRAPVTLYMTPYDDQTLEIAGVKQIDIAVNARVPINAIGTTITFPQDSMEILGFNKQKSFFDLWTEETAINEDLGEIHFSGGTIRPGGLVGTGTVLTLTVRAKKSGHAQLEFRDVQVYAGDGTGETVDTDARTLAFDVPEPPRIFSNAIQTAPQPERPLPRSADLNGDGAVNLVDMSIMIIHFMPPYDQRFDLDMDGVVGISDLSILLASVH